MPRLSLRLSRRGHEPASLAQLPQNNQPLWWRWGVLIVCMFAGLMLATTHNVSGGSDIRRSDAPRLVDLVGVAEKSVRQLSAQRDVLTATITAARTAAPGEVLIAINDRVGELPAAAGLDSVHGPGLVVTLSDAQRDADGLFPPDASPDDLVVHEQDIQAVVNALWSSGAEAIDIQGQRIIAASAVRCVGNTLLLDGRTYSPPYVIGAIGDAAAMQEALATAPLVELYQRYVVRFGLGYQEDVVADLDIAGYSGPLRMRYAQPLAR